MDTPITNFDLPDNQEPESLVDRLKRMHALLEQRADFAQERSSDLDWQLCQTHVMSGELFALLESDDTPPDVKHRILLATYTGEQWVKTK